MLKSLTKTWKDGCNDKTLTYSEYIIIDDKKIPVKAILKDDCYINGNFIGSFIFKEISFETENNIDFKKKEFEYYKTVNGESIKLGTFITTEITDNDTTELVKVIGMDFGLKTQVEYISSLDYSSGLITLLDVWHECCELSGLESGINEFTNSDFIVENDQFTGTGATIRDVFIAIAQSSCSFVKVMNDDKIYLVFNEQTDDVIEDYTDLDDKRDTQPITCVRLGMSQIIGENVDLKDEELVKEYGEHWLIINDNPFAYTQAKRAELIYAILDKVKAVGHTGFTAKTSFKPYLTCGDIVKFKNRKGQLINSILLRYEHNYEEITLEAPSETSATVSYVYPANEIDLIKRTEVIVDKHENKITSLTHQTQTLQDNLDSDYYTIKQTDELIQTSGEGITNTFSEAGGNNIFKNTSLNSPAEGLISVTEKGDEIVLSKLRNFTLNSLRINGYSKQKNYIGKNLLNVPSEYTITGVKQVDIDLPAGIYIANWESIMTDGTETDMLLYFYYEDGTNYSRYISPTYESKRLIFELTKKVNKIGIYSQNNWNNSQGVTTSFKDLMISIDGGEYEPYVGGQSAPNKDYPQDIEVVKGNVLVKSTNPETNEESEIIYNLGDNFIAEGDYIKDNILYKNTRHLRLAIKDMNNAEDYPGWKQVQQLYDDYPNFNGRLSVKCKYKSNISNASDAFAINTNNNNKILYLGKSIWGLTQSEWKEKYPNLILDLYYEIPETLEIPLESVGKLDINGNCIITNNFGSEMKINYTKENDGYEFWNGKVIKNSNDNATNFSSMLLQKGSLSQEQDVTNGNYSVSFYYQKLNQFANASVVINDKEYSLDSMDVKQFYTGEQNSETGKYIVEPVKVASNHIKIEFKCNVNNGVEVWDLMCNKGSVKLAWSQNQNEITTDTVNISKGITITSTNIEAIFKANANGIRILTLQGATVAYFTDKGLSTKELIVENKAQICGTLVQEVDGQTWFTRM